MKENKTSSTREACHRPRNSWEVEGSENCHVNITAERSAATVKLGKVSRPPPASTFPGSAHSRFC